MNIFKRFISCILFLCICVANAQQDSLAKLTYNQLELKHYELRNTDISLARIYVNRFLKKAIAEKAYPKVAKSYILLGNLENYNEDYNLALKYIDTCITYCHQYKRDRTLLFAYKVKGNIYRNMGDYDNSISYHLKVDSIAKEINDPLQQMRSNHNIAIIKAEIGNTKEAISIFQDNLTKLKSNDVALYNESLYTNTLISLASTHIEVDLEKAIYYNSVVKELATKSNNSDDLSYHYMYKGKIAYHQNHFTAALLAFNKADSIISNLENKGNLFTIYRLKGKTLFKSGNYNDAITILEKAKELYKNKGYQHFQLQEIFTSLAKSYAKIGNQNKALENFELGSSLNDKKDHVKINVSKKIKEKYEIANFKEEIQKLKDVTAKEQKKNNLLKTTGGFLSVLLLVIIGLFIKNKRTNKKKFNKLLAHINSLESQQKQTKTNQQKSTSTNTISNEKVVTLLKSLEKFENKNEFLNPKTSLNFVAKKLNTNTNYLSKIINQHKGKSFTNYITELRINYALQRIKNDKIFRSFSIKGIAEELGFKSEGSFSRAFKQHTGIYPSYFIKKITSDS
ncbi:helix-turn-helix domain-containing protein [uncultured Kordia sp.]|uniref:helix-turn-helix domain-containing protein n=1 Tax=uncultured Kordia sp. TaxID=507699 RepID=UPI00260D5B8D|nr:helix-turn-helix domain-containing protein [uncultured Kordia sp.]